MRVYIFHSSIGDIYLYLQNGKLRKCRFGRLCASENLRASSVKIPSCLGYVCRCRDYYDYMDAVCSHALQTLTVFLVDYFNFGVGDDRAIQRYLCTNTISAFCLSVYGKLAEIKPGNTISYFGLAEAIGRPGAARAVGAALSRNPFPIFFPCHRVIKSDGGIGGFIGGYEWKRELLEYEARK